MFLWSLRSLALLHRTTQCYRNINTSNANNNKIIYKKDWRCITILADRIDTAQLSFQIKPEFKEEVFNDFKNGIINGVRRKWHCKKLRKPKTQKELHLKGKNCLYFYYPGYDNFYKRAYLFTGKYDDYSLYYCHYKYRSTYILVHIQHNLIASKSKDEVYEDTLLLLDSIGVDTSYLKLKNKINRIDYKHDFECEDKPIAEKQAILNVLSKTRNSFNGIYKEKLEKGIGIKYKPMSSYIEIIVYDKEQERKDRLKNKKRTAQVELELKKYKNVFRTELRLKNKRLYYNKKHTLKKDKTLNNYYNEQVEDECFRRYVEPIFYTEPFYRIDYALTAIQTDCRLTEKEAKKLCKLVIDINEKGFTRAKQEYNYCDDTFEKHIKLLRSIGINPLTFDEDIDLAILHNFTTKEVCRDYSIYEEQSNSNKKVYDDMILEINQEALEDLFNYYMKM